MMNFIRYANDIKEIEKELESMTYEQAREKYHKHYADDDLCDIDFGLDMIGTIHNDNGRPYISEYTLFEIYQSEDDYMPYIALRMTKDEIFEQAKRLEGLQHTEIV